MSKTNPTIRSPRRSFLYVPGDAKRKIEKAATWAVDVLILDLEDGVAVNRKEAARQVIVEALGTLDFGATERLVSRLSRASISQTSAGRLTSNPFSFNWL